MSEGLPSAPQPWEGHPPPSRSCFPWASPAFLLENSTHGSEEETTIGVPAGGGGMCVSDVATRWHRGRTFPGQSRGSLHLPRAGKAPELGLHSGCGTRTVRTRLQTGFNSTGIQTALQMGSWEHPFRSRAFAPRRSPEIAQGQQAADWSLSFTTSRQRGRAGA